MEIHQLRYFVAVAEARSFSRGAARCGVSQPSLSQQVQKLEQEIGERLFDRLGRAIALTPAGAALLPRARRILAEVDQAKSEVTDELGAGRGRIVVGAIPTIAPYLLPRAVGELCRRYPRAEVILREALTQELLEGVANAEIDLCLCSLPIEDDRLAYEELLDEPLLFVVAASHPLASRRRIPLEALEGEPVVVLEDLHCLGQQIQGLCRQRELTLRVICRSTQLRTVQNLVATGLGVSLVPLMCAAADHMRGCAYRPVGQSPPRRKVVAAWHKGRTRSLLAERFLEIVRKDCGALAEWKPKPAA